ncbi:helix-turn-helix domain-containing protein [Pseudonocardia sp. CA-107938]|uniref:helix-turn-helix domain-containing protein n=1 Tax=Pseudonocardia sp. CA-107938 TaxID=3240021 RepID=UPI003D94520F
MTGGTVRQRILGRRLRRMREEAGLSIEVAAPALDCSVSKLTRIEGARQGLDSHLARSMLDLYDVGGARWAETLELVKEAREKPWWKQYGLGDKFNYVQFETDAALVQDFAPSYVPGLLQTREYARALFSSNQQSWSAGKLEAALEVRMIRQQRLTDTERRLRLVAVAGEAALRNPVGDPDVMDAQLAHIAEAATLPAVTLQVLPAHPGPHAALASGFTVLSFGELDEPDMVFVEHALGAAFVEDERGVAMARRKFDQLRTLALNPADSLDLLRDIAAAT